MHHWYRNMQSLLSLPLNKVGRSGLYLSLPSTASLDATYIFLCTSQVAFNNSSLFSRAICNRIKQYGIQQ